MKRILAFMFTMLLGVAFLPLQVSAAASIPVLVVKSFSVNPSPVEPGQVFTLEITLKNEGKKDADNITLTLGNTDESKTPESSGTQANANDFLPVESGNVVYVDKIKKGAEQTVSFKLSSKNDTSPGIYDINLALSYSYSRITFNSNSKIGISIEQKDSLVIKGLTYPQKIKLGEEAALSGDIVNISNASLKAVTVDYSGEGLEKQSEFFGVFEPNNSDTLENTIKPAKAGYAHIGVTVTYYDSFGKKQEVKQEISIWVESTEKEQAQTQNNGSGFLDFIKFLLGLGSGK